MRIPIMKSIPSVPAPVRKTAMALTLALLAIFGPAPAPVQAQNLFSAAIRVNDDAITVYELEQRTQFLRLLAAPGDPNEMARNVLIEERLKKQVLATTNIEASPEDIEAGIEEFAARTELSAQAFVEALENGGVSRETLRDFVGMGILWRQYVSARFLDQARPDDAEIDRAIGLARQGGVRVLLSEVIIPITPQSQAQAQSIAQQISDSRGPDAFSASATQYSASQSRANGGEMDWLALADLPAGLRPIILAMVPGENTPPISLPNAVAVFRMRAIQGSVAPTPRYASIDYARYYIAGGRSPEALALAQSVRNRADTCNDLYGIAKDQPEQVLERQTQNPGNIARDIARELAKLDTGEFSTALTRDNGQTLVLLMLCGRTAVQAQNATREEVALSLTQARLDFLSAAFLGQLEADALIVEQ